VSVAVERPGGQPSARADRARAGVPVRARPGRRATLAVALHDIEPATFERCALIRDWLDDHGVGRVTLLVIPAADLHPFQERSPALAAWLRERVCLGDEIAQHGLAHRQGRPGGQARQALARWQAAGSAEFVGLDGGEARRAVESGRRLLKLAGLEPRGFVAPGYAYTPDLRAALSGRYAWWASLLHVHRAGRRATLAPAVGLGSSTLVKRTLSPLVVRGLALTSGRHLRLDLHPADLDHPRHVLALEGILARAARRTPATYDDLLAPA